MNKRHTIYIIVLLIFIFIVNNIYILDKNSKLDIYSFRKPFVLGSDIDMDNFYEKNIFTTSTNFTSDEIKSNYLSYKKLSNKEAKEDVDFLLYELKDKYPLYSAKSKEDLKKIKNNIYNDIYDGIASKELEKILIRHLKFVDDSHFRINNKKIKPNFITQTVDGITIDKIGNDYYIKNNKIINIEEIKECIKPSINKIGSVDYRLFFKKRNIYQRPPKFIILENNRKIDLNWKSTNNIDHKNLKPEYYETMDYGVLKIKEFYHPDNLEYQRYTMENIRYLTNKSYQILDLRGNHGGNGVLASGLFYNYSGYKPLHSHDSILTIDFKKLLLEGFQDDIEYIKSHLNFMGYERIDNNTFILRKSDKVYRKEEPLFILVDGSTSSASEHLIDMFKHMSNSIIVGIPTSGTMRSSSAYDIVLNNSNITVSFGNMYINYNENYFKEFYGFEPDIWIEPEDAEENIIKFINNIIYNNN